MLASYVVPKFIKWVKLLGKYISVQLIVQAITFASGMLLIRTLSKQEYAFFTLANSMQGIMSNLADIGVSSSLLAIGGKVWQDKYRFGQLVNTATRLRRYFAIISVIIVTPILFWMLINNGASNRYAVLMIVAIIVELNFTLATGVLNIVPKLNSKIKQVQSLEFSFSASRLLMLGVAYFTYLNAGVALFVSTIASGLQKTLISNWAKKDIDLQAPISLQDKAEILRIVKICLPTTLFYCVQGQITIWLISLFGNTQNIAEVGALGRLEVIFALIGSIMGNVLSPSFARCQSRNKLKRLYFKILGLTIFLESLIVIAAFLFPMQILWVLGPKYYNLQDVLFLMTIGAVLKNIVGTIFSMNNSKAWLEHGWVMIPIVMIWQGILLLFLNISLVEGVIWFGILTNIPYLIFNLFLSYRGFKQFTQAG